MHRLPFFIFLSVFSLVYAESVHWQWRELVCKTKEGDDGKHASTCELQLKEHENDEQPRTVPFNTCFEETTDGEVRNYCDILCPGADTAYRITRYPQQHKSCYTHITYRLQRREENFYMWRSGKCRTSDIAFTIRCEFASARADFASDEELFRAARRLQ
ncbi:unnamed protein product [Caenorhabditis auriculariae]|uniref:DUF7808 domain-containing protein n=1 Tax=Caenorhabditis auriculariae TaxID=2777116 RepID=A0A8S1HKR3_9PELO|nr:unnamed protein product [Caenorhabditis auriculariae]